MAFSDTKAPGPSFPFAVLLLSSFLSRFLFNYRNHKNTFNTIIPILIFFVPNLSDLFYVFMIHSVWTHLLLTTCHVSAVLCMRPTVSVFMQHTCHFAFCFSCITSYPKPCACHFAVFAIIIFNVFIIFYRIDVPSLPPILHYC